MISSVLIASIRWRKRIATRGSGSAPEKALPDIIGNKMRGEFRPLDDLPA